MQHANLTNRKLVFVRHGEYSRNDDGRQQHLTEAGRAQAEAVGQWMKNICSITMIWHSHMARSAETAQIVAGILSPRLPMHNSQLLNEVGIDHLGKMKVSISLGFPLTNTLNFTCVSLCK